MGSFDKDKLNSFPEHPGVYLMKGRSGVVLYVGKAKNLRTRVKQYFLAKGDGRAIVPLLVAKVEEIDTIVVFSEKEALLLENNLIKKHSPPYNALLKDDKSYIALKVNHKNPWPSLELIRYKGKLKPDALYFGPYTSAHSARKTFDLLNRLFPLRQCSDQEFARRKRPCILYDMKRCMAPCVGKCTKEEYQKNVDRTTKFLKGKDKEILKELYEEMERASSGWEFEKAAVILRTIRQIESTLEEQRVDKPIGMDMDALAVYREADEVVLAQLMFRGGKLIGSHQYDFTSIVEEDHELFESFLIQYYEKQGELPQEILLPISLEQAHLISDIISQNKNRHVEICCPQRGEKKALVAMASTNAEAGFNQKKDAQSIREKTLLEMQEKLHLNQFPEKIECFDNSHISGASLVSTLVVFTNGAKDSSRYRKYKIRDIDTSDDYGAIREALQRRYRTAKEESDLPNLLIVDGGKGHLNVALKVLESLDIVSVDVIGVAKEQGRHDKGTTVEQIFLPNLKDPILLRKNSPVLFLLQQIRDEAHRTAIAYHRKLHGKRNLTSALQEVPGIGPVKRKKLLTYFGSVKKLLEANPVEFESLKFLSKRDREAILNFRLKKTES